MDTKRLKPTTDWALLMAAEPGRPDTGAILARVRRNLEQMEEMHRAAGGTTGEVRDFAFRDDEVEGETL